MPKATDPIRLTKVIHHDHSRERQATQAWQTSNHASALATRKQIEPRASGRHTWWLAASDVRFSRRAVPQLTLKKRVPTSCTAVAHQSIRRGWKTKKRRRVAPDVGRAASTASRYARNPAAVKNSAPKKRGT